MRHVLLIILLGLALGCGKPRSLIGQWSIRGGSGDGTVIYRDDCTFRSYTESANLALVLDGTYELKGDNLRLHVVRWDVPKGPEISADDRKRIDETFAVDPVSSLSWTDDDHFRLTGANGGLTTAERVSK